MTHIIATKGSFTRENRIGHQFIIERVEQTKYDLIPLQGNGIVTHVGGNGRFRFNIDGIGYTSTFDRSIAIKGDDKTAEVGYYDILDVVLNIDIEKEWSKLYIDHDDKTNYWKEI